MVYLDTHVIVWLYAGSLDLVPKEAQRILNNEDLFISPIVELELQYLREAGRIKKTPAEILKALHKEINLKVCDKPFPSVVKESLNMHWTKDPFDRIIVAQAALNHNILLTKDETIQSHYKKAAW